MQSGAEVIGIRLDRDAESGGAIRIRLDLDAERRGVIRIRFDVDAKTGRTRTG
jgi:hypothetical protein